MFLLHQENLREWLLKLYQILQKKGYLYVYTSLPAFKVLIDKIRSDLFYVFLIQGVVLYLQLSYFYS